MSSLKKEEPLVLSPLEWQGQARAHTNKIARITAPFRQWRGLGQKHPVYDFLFVYYPFSAAKLERWQPGFGVLLELDSSESSAFFSSNPSYAVTCGTATLKTDLVCKAKEVLKSVDALCAAVSTRPARFNCFGLHEWAMLYRTTETRHAVPLRLSVEEISCLVETLGLRCSHYDAYRFFTDKAKPRNMVTLSRKEQTFHEQRGCIHLNMDIYKWAYSLFPLVSSDFLRRAFDLALAARELDMRASPYDLSAYGFSPICIETVEGRQEYRRQQEQISRAGDVIRGELYQMVQRFLGVE